jgi:hypothetical protein
MHDFLFANVDSNHTAFLSYVVRGNEGIDSKARTKIKYFFAGLELGKVMWISHALIVAGISPYQLDFFICIAEILHDSFSFLQVPR